MKIINKILSPIGTFLLMFSTSYAASTCDMKSIKDFKSLISILISCFLNPLVVIITSLSIVIFLFGVFKFMKSTGGDDKNSGKSFMFWGIVGIFVIVSLWGFVSIFQETIDLSGEVRTPRQIDIKIKI